MNDIKIIDCFGDICPIPILKIERELESIEAGQEFMIVVDHSCTIEAIKNKYQDSKNEIRIEEVMNGVWEIYFKKLASNKSL